MIKHFFLLIFLIGLNCCTFTSCNENKNSEFYETISGWGIKYIPIMEPFRAYSVNREEWIIEGEDDFVVMDNTRYGGVTVESLGVSKNFIYGIAPPQHPKGVKKWFLFNTENLIYAEYSTETELSNTLKKYNLEKNPIKSCETYFKELIEGKKCYWYPEKGDKYPEFNNFQPDSSIEIIVEGDEKGIDFQAPNELKRLESKIYYFKMKYNHADNDLFYVSINNTTPALIRNDLVIPAYAWSNSLHISVYTPYPVGQKKGIEEKDRIVLTKIIQLIE